MNYPLISEYTEAILSAEDNFNELTNLRPVLDNAGHPVMSSGNFAVVYKMCDINTDKMYAVKCFTREQLGREMAYQKISHYLQHVYCDFIVKVNYYSDELYVDTRQSDSSEFPVLVMDWIDGMGLEEYISQNADNRDKLELLSSNFIDMVGTLLPHHFAHGDLKPDNIIIDRDDKIKLIDYDGMFVPSMEGEFAPELGTPKFQFHKRKPEDFNESIDDYGALYLSLLLRLVAISDKKFDYILSLDTNELISIVGENHDDVVISKLLSAYLLVLNRGFIEREVLSVCLFDENKYDREKELSYVSRARKGDTTAMILLGDTYSRGTFTPENASKAIDWYYLARALGDINAACGVCRHYYHFENDFYGLSIAENIIHKGLLKAQNDFSLCREGEEYMFKDKEYALPFLKNAAKLNFAPAIRWLSSYQDSAGDKIMLLEKAAELGDATALKRLGDKYKKGEDSLPKNSNISLIYYQRAAELGDSECQYIVGMAHLLGQGGINKEINTALKWLGLASTQGYSKATCILSRLYIDGKIVEQNINYALELLNKLTSRTNPDSEALYILGFCYHHGTGVIRDIEKAVSLYTQSIESFGGYSQSEIELDIIMRKYHIKDETYVNPQEEYVPDETKTGLYSVDGKRIIGYCTGLELNVKPGTKVLCDNCFNDLYNECDCHYLRKLVLPESIVRIGNNVFCSSIKEILFKNPSFRFKVEKGMLLSRDGKILYRYFGNEKVVEIPSTVVYIKGGAFSELEITEIIIPDSVKYLGANPFAGTGYFDSTNIFVHPKIISHSPYILIYGKCVYSTSEKTLIDCWSDNNIIVKEGCENIGENAFWNANLELISLPSSIISIHESAFYGFRMKLNRIQVEYEDEEHFKNIVPNFYQNLVTGLPF